MMAPAEWQIRRIETRTMVALLTVIVTDPDAKAKIEAIQRAVRESIPGMRPNDVADDN